MSDPEDIEPIEPPIYHTIVLADETYNFIGIAISYTNCVLSELTNGPSPSNAIQKCIMLQALLEIDKDKDRALRIIKEILTQLSPR